ncbi:MAG TPA: hypothetical protein VGI99_11085 [Gemmataceae bacterium]
MRAPLALEELRERATPSSLSISDASAGSLMSGGLIRGLDSDPSDSQGPGPGPNQGGGGRHHDDPGAVTTTTQFTAIANATFIDLPASSFLTPVSAAGVTIIASNDADGSFFNFPVGTADAPGSGDGFINFNHDLFTNVSPLTLNFSAPVASFGVSFLQMPPSSEGGAFSTPDVLKVYDGANGTGNLLGTVTSSGFLPAGDPTGQHSFVAVLSSSANIHSAVLVGTGPTLGFAVDGYALSVTPQGTGTDH